ncbi:MAG: AbrB/MazE/SpoVT family DNA-binding domain-containing protein [Gammaproteobacteria bacterium]|nr:AbrB/MazE/SpoVT family DNA-binding domain-containing protein [Gammaproteobacteria bacterium]
MSKVTSKLQVTLPKRIAERHGITPGDEIDFESAGEAIRIVTRKRRTATELSVAERLRLFDEATTRQARTTAQQTFPQRHTGERDWTREDLYSRGSTD